MTNLMNDFVMEVVAPAVVGAGLGAAQRRVEGLISPFVTGEATTNHLRGTPAAGDMKPEVITKTSQSKTRKGDDLFQRSSQGGDAVMINCVPTKRTRLSLGTSIAPNNTAFLHELLNRRTSVSTSGGYHYNAPVGERSWHMQHFRHNAYNSAEYIGGYDYQKLPEDESGDCSTISLITPNTQVVGGGTTGIPLHTTAYKPVEASANGDIDQYSPYSLTDLENVSYNLQRGKDLTTPSMSLDVQNGNASGISWELNPLLMPKNVFAARSRIYQQNQYINTLTEPDTSGTPQSLVDNNIKLKSCLMGGKIEYLFTNTGTSPASITVVVYKVKQTYNSPLAIPGLSAAQTLFCGDTLKKQFLTTQRQAYLDKGQKLRLKNMDGREPVEEDITLNSKFQLLPKVKPVVASSVPFVEEMRYNHVIAAGQTKNIDISLPGRLYDPTSSKNTVSFAKTSRVDFDTQDAIATGSPLTYPEFWSGEQYSVAIGVAGMPALLSFKQTQTIDTSLVDFTQREGQITAAASVTCRVRYTERIGAMNMSFKSKPIRGRSTFDPPSRGDQPSVNPTTVSTVAVVPLVGAERTSSDGIINL